MKRILLILFLSLVVLPHHILAKKYGQELVDSLLIELPKAALDTNKINTLVKLSYAYAKIDPKKGLQYGETAIELADSISWEVGKANAFSRIAINYIMVGKKAEGLQAFNNALEIFKSHDKQKKVGETYNNIGIFYRIYSEFGKGMEYHHKAKKVYNDIKFEVGLARVYNNMGRIYYMQSNYAKALDNYYKALRILEKEKDKSSLPGVLNSLGNYYSRQSQYKKALKYYKKALLLFEEMNDIANITTMQTNIAGIFFSKKEYKKSIEYYKKSIKVLKRIGLTRVIPPLNVQIGNAYFEQKKYNTAIYYFKIAEDLQMDAEDKTGKVNTFFAIARLYFYLSQDSILKDFKPHSKYISNNSQKNLTLSINYFLDALMLAKEINIRNKIQESLYYLANIYSSKGDYKKSLEYYKQHTAIKDSIFNDESKTKIAEIENQRESDLKDAEIKMLNEKNKFESTQKNIILYFSIFGITLLVILLIVLFKKYKFKTQSELLLQEKNKKILEHSQKVQSTLTQLETAQEQLIEAEKTASIGILVSGIAHEINNPLNYIQGGIFALNNYFNKYLIEHKTKVAPMINGIEVGLERATNIVKGLNSFNRENDTIVEECNIHTIIDNCIMVLNNKLDQRIDIDKQYSTSNLLSMGNEGKLHQVFLSILINSIDAIDDKGTIKIISKIDKEYIIIKIIDTGCGISEETLSKISLPFYTTKAPGEGTGLGLSIVFKIIEDHNGIIEYESKLGYGTTVIIKLKL